jgi:hypothetical protein
VPCLSLGYCSITSVRPLGRWVSCRRQGGVHEVASRDPPGDAKTPTSLAATSAFSFLDVLRRDVGGIRSLRHKGERDDADRVDEPRPGVPGNDRATHATPNERGQGAGRVHAVRASAGLVRTVSGRPAQPAGIGHSHQPTTSASDLAPCHDMAAGHRDAQPLRTAARGSRSVGASRTAWARPPHTLGERPRRRYTR